MKGIELILNERVKQVEKGYDLASDVLINHKGQLRVAARKLLVKEPQKLMDYPPEEWDIELWQKLVQKPEEDRIRIAGAFCAAELDRILL